MSPKATVLNTLGPSSQCTKYRTTGKLLQDMILWKIIFYLYLSGFICVVSFFYNDHNLEIWKIGFFYGNSLWSRFLIRAPDFSILRLYRACGKIGNQNLARMCGCPGLNCFWRSRRVTTGRTPTLARLCSPICIISHICQEKVWFPNFQDLQVLVLYT